MLVFLQVINGLLIIPMVCLGFMASLSGGGVNPSYQTIGRSLVFSPILSIACIIGTEILKRQEQEQLAYLLIFVPILAWVGLLIWLQVSTNFFF